MKTLLTMIVTFLVCFGFGPLPLVADDSAHYLNDQNPVVGKIGDKTVMLQSLEDKQINDLRKKLYDAISGKFKMEALRNLAKTHKKYAIQIDPKISKQEISEFYHGNKLSSKGTLKELSKEIEYYLTRYKRQQMRTIIDRMYEQAIQEKLVTQFIQVPNDFLVTVPLETGFIRNQGTSQVMVLEYSDYQCPACRMVQPVIAQLRQKLDKKVTFAYRHFPLSFHTEADEASLAVECGREQGNFEKFHQYFYENQAALGNEKARIMDYLKSLGKELKIDDPKKFERCLDNQKYRDLVRNDINTGMDIGISGTPAFIVGKYDPKTKKLSGELFTGGMPVAEFEKLINKYM